MVSLRVWAFSYLSIFSGDFENGHQSSHGLKGYLGMINHRAVTRLLSLRLRIYNTNLMLRIILVKTGVATFYVSKIDSRHNLMVFWFD